jgi:hypothetical protein
MFTNSHFMNMEAVFIIKIIVDVEVNILKIMLYFCAVRRY